MKIKALKTLIYGLSAFVICFSVFTSPSQAAAKNDTIVNNGFKLKTIIVDAGHGGTIKVIFQKVHPAVILPKEV
jgi:N-acetylmuramoyl-L-alanine amidase